MFPFHVCSFAEVPSSLAAFQPQRLVSLLDPGVHMAATVECVAHLRLAMFDTCQPSATGAPTLAHVHQMLEFDTAAVAGEITLVHCNAGVSRSTAAVLIMVASRFGAAALPEAVDWLWRTRDEVQPNRLMLELGDEVLGLKGSLARAGGVLRDRWKAVHGGRGMAW